VEEPRLSAELVYESLGRDDIIIFGIRLKRSANKEKTAKVDMTDPEIASEDLEEPLLSSSSTAGPDSAIAPEEEQPEQGEVDTTNGDNVLATRRMAAQSPPRRRDRSLAWMRSTPLLAKLFIPLLIVSNHFIFYYGQTANMWRLTGSWKADLHYQVVSLETKTAFQTLKIDTVGSYVADTQKDLRTFTYAYAIEELWKAKGMPGVLLPRLAAVGLIVFSGLWPHLKLFMLLLTW
jgi:hypothetical protein